MKTLKTSFLLTIATLIGFASFSQGKSGKIRTSSATVRVHKSSTVKINPGVVVNTNHRVNGVAHANANANIRAKQHASNKSVFGSGVVVSKIIYEYTD